jgi:replication fork protection complex subunit Tof1/Swi1
VVKIAMFKNGHLRLLMRLVGFQRIGTDEEEIGSPWMIPSGLSADQLKQSLDLIKQTEFNPPVFDDGQEAEDFIRRKSAGTAARRRATYDDDSDNGLDSGEEEFLFPAGGPTAMKKSAALEALKKRRRRRKSGSDEEDGGLTEEQRKARAEARRTRELEKLRKIKSELYVHDSDEESDEERDNLFFEQEEKLRQRTKLAALQHLTGLGKPGDNAAPKSSAASNGRKRGAREMSSESETDEDDAPRARHHSSSTKDDEESGNEATDTPLSSSPHIRSSQTKRLKISRDIRRSESVDISDDDDDRQGHRQSLDTQRDKTMRDVPPAEDDGDEEDDAPVVRTAARRRVTAGFVIDSSDEE